jgi:hypothetical protein
MGSRILLSGSVAAASALIHLIGGRLNFLRVTPRSVSFAVGTGADAPLLVAGA